jgi:DNA-binding Lrp family transcriptional regulator
MGGNNSSSFNPKVKGIRVASNGKNPEKKNDSNIYRRTFDSLDMQIIDELLVDADISSAAIASKYGVPLSTIQRRRATLESMSMLTHNYDLNPNAFGFREVEFWLLVEKGKADEVARHIFEKYNNVLSVRVQINSISNVGVTAYVDSSEELYTMLEEIKSMHFVEEVEFAEIVKLVDKRPANFFKVRMQNPIKPA